MIEIINGNILDTDCNIICHQVNCQGVMGAGLAKQIKEKYPEVFREYKDLCDRKSYREKNDLMGMCQIILTFDGKYVANLFGQFRYGRDKKHTDEEMLKKSLITLRNFADEHQCSIAIPYNIGCGLAGGDWNVVEEMIEEVFENYKYGVKFYKL